LGQIGHERIHRREIGRIDELTAHAPLRDEAGMRELLQVKAERGRENAEAFGEYTGGEPVGSALDQQAKEREPRLMRERAECRHRRLGLHVILRYFDDNQIIKRKREASRDMSKLIEIRAAAAPYSAACVSMPAYSLSLSAWSAGITSVAKRRRFFSVRSAGKVAKWRLARKFWKPSRRCASTSLPLTVSGLPQRKMPASIRLSMVIVPAASAGRLIARMPASDLAER